MKLLLAAMMLLIPLAGAYAQCTVPGSVFREEKVDKAAASAQKKGKALTFVLASGNDLWGGREVFSSKTLRALRKHSVVVYLDHRKKSAYQELSPVVVGALAKTKKGVVVPRAVVISPDQTTWFANLTFNEMPDSKVNAAVKETVEAGMKVETGPNPDTSKCFQGWQLKDSKECYTGKFLRMEDDNNTLVIKLAKDGKFPKAMKGVRINKNMEMPIPMDRLSPGAQRFARIYAGLEEFEGLSETTAEPPSMEVWESASGGKTITAQFRSLTGNKVTLVLESGRTSTFDIAKLSEKSQQRVKELAEN